MEFFDVEALNDNFAIPGHVGFRTSRDGLILAEIRNAHAAASVSLQGGHVVSYAPHGQAPVLFTSAQSAFAPGKTIRGGIPICWPWFGPHPTDPTLPQHGFVRSAEWSLRSTARVDPDATQVRLRLTDTPESREIWPHAFELIIAVTIGTELRVELIVRNPAPEAMRCTEALHTYLQVGDITATRVLGLDGITYLDKVDGMRPKQQEGPIMIEGETDRIYVDVPRSCVVDDPALGRHIHIAKTDSKSTVIWNPWREKARALKDFGDDEYLHMLCVEVANAGNNHATVAPGGEHRLGTTIRVERATAQ